MGPKLHTPLGLDRGLSMAPPPLRLDEAWSPDLQDRGWWPLQQELRLLLQPAEPLVPLASRVAVWAAGLLAAGQAVRAEAPRARVVAAAQGDRLSQPLQADGAEGQLPRHHGPGPQAQLRLGDWCVGPGGRTGHLRAACVVQGVQARELGAGSALSSRACITEPGDLEWGQRSSGQSDPG